ncbi:unnamed protein product [Ectocarpus fasciculatus]
MPPSSRPLDGLVWPLVPNSKKAGDRSTTWANKQALAAAIGAVDPALAQRVLDERNWRQKYTKYVYKHVEACLQSKEAAVASSKAGLEWVHNNFEFVREGKSMKLAAAMSSITGSFETAVVKGTKPKPTETVLQVPYKDEILTGKALEDQVDKWVSYGTIEPSAGAAIKDVSQKGEWRDLSDRYFVLLGAGSAMGPLKLLLELGANIVAIDLDRPAIWQRLLGLAEDSCGTMIFPLKEGKPQASLSSREELCAAAGANLLAHTPEILNWLKTVSPEKPLVVGSYAYLDGELHVRLSLAMDAIVKGLTESRRDVMPAYLCTPTDVHVIPSAAHDAAASQARSLGLVNLLCKITGNLAMTLTSNVKPAVVGADGGSLYLVDGLVNKQGPNYALAKRMQHWRAVVARQEYRCKVSSNIAPSTATASVVSNRLFAMAYGGMHFFQPMEVFQQETSNAVMGALLLRDVADPATPSNPTLPLKNPLQLFSFGSFHGGVWRMAYTIDSIGTASVLAYLLVGLLALLKYFLLAFVVGFAAMKAKDGENPLEALDGVKDSVLGLFKGEL